MKKNLILYAGSPVGCCQLGGYSRVCCLTNAQFRSMKQSGFRTISGFLLFVNYRDVFFFFFFNASIMVRIKSVKEIGECE
jgi:hypothetical protein